MTRSRDNANMVNTARQVVNSSSTTQTNVASTSYIQVGGSALTVTITPQQAANKVLVTVNLACYSPTQSNGFMAIYRGGTLISEYGYYQYQAGEFNYGTVSFLDSPATTSATTYSVYAKAPSSVTWYINYSDGGGTNKSSITAMEIVA